MWPYYHFPNMAGPYGRSTSGHVVPATALRGDNLVPILNDDGTYILVS